MDLMNLVIKLFFDDSDYKKGINDAKKETEKFEESTAKSALSTIAKWTGVSLTVAKVVSTLKSLVVDSTQYADNIKNMAQIYGYTTKEIQEMQSVAEQSGKSLEMVLRGIKSSGETAAEYLGLSNEEYAEMVDNAYKFGTILNDDALNAVDALGDRIAYLKSEGKAAITALLAGEENAEEAVDAWFRNIESSITEYAPTIIKFVLRLVMQITKSIAQILPELTTELISQVIDTIFSINWFEVGWDIIKAIFKGIFKGFGKVFSKLFGIEEVGGEPIEGGTSFVSTAKIGANDYAVEESVKHDINVNLKFEGDTPISESNAELVGENLAHQIDEILGRRLNG